MVRLVIDANRIVSALLKDGVTREAILKTRTALFAPEHLRDEIGKHLPEFARRAGVTEPDLAVVLNTLLRRIEWVPLDAFRPYLARAKRALGRVDPNDFPYLACALAVHADAIWSQDLDFDKQRLVPRVPHVDAKVP